MSHNTSLQALTRILSQPLRETLADFLMDRKAQDLSDNTLRIYSGELSRFVTYLEKEGVTTVEMLTARDIRRYIVELQKTRNQGGISVFHRTLKMSIFGRKCTTHIHQHRASHIRQRCTTLATDAQQKRLGF